MLLHQQLDPRELEHLRRKSRLSRTRRRDTAHHQAAGGKHTSIIGAWGEYTFSGFDAGDVGQPIMAAAAFRGGSALDHQNGSCGCKAGTSFISKRPPEKRLQPIMAAPHVVYHYS